MFHSVTVCDYMLVFMVGVLLITQFSGFPALGMRRGEEPVEWTDRITYFLSYTLTHKCSEIKPIANIVLIRGRKGKIYI